MVRHRRTCAREYRRRDSWCSMNVLFCSVRSAMGVGMERSPYDFPPPENPRAARLSDLITCRIEIQCCEGTVDYPVKLMLRHHSDRTLADAVNRLRCSRCRGKPQAVWLNQVPNRDPAWVRHQDGRCGCFSQICSGACPASPTGLYSPSLAGLPQPSP